MDQRKKFGVEIDMISSLPDDVLVHILSLLPLKTSVCTSILSRRWLHLWKHTTKLIFTNIKHVDFVNSVNSVLKSHRALSLQEITFDFVATTKDLHDVAKWLDFAFSKRVERLDLIFQGWWIGFQHVLHLQSIIAQLAPTSMHSLRFLCLRQTKIDNAVIRFFLGNCPLIEGLVIQNAVITSDLELVGPSLKNLDLTRSENNWEPLSIKVSAPNLTHITIDYDAKGVFLENVPKLVSMNFGCRSRAMMHNFAAAVSQLKDLTICMLYRRMASFRVPEMRNLKRLAVYDHCHIPTSGNIPFPVTSFLRASPCLEEFVMQITELGLEEGVGDVFRHASLKRFKMWWSCGDGSPPREINHIKLVRYIVESCVALEEIEINRCEDAKKWRSWFYVVVDNDRVRVATTEERASFENTTQLQLPTHIKLRIGINLEEKPQPLMRLIYLMDQRKNFSVEINMLSSLPDDLLVHILSFLPLKTSVSTSILSRQWLHLWKYTSKLIFTNIKHVRTYVNSVNSVLKSHRALSLQEITFDFAATTKDLHNVAKWLDFAFSRRAERLDLIFRGWLIEFQDALHLEDIIAHHLHKHHCNMRFLRVLLLRQTEINSAVIRFFLGNCPLLEGLVIQNARITSDLELLGPSLNWLYLTRPQTSWKAFSVKVSAPDLTHITIDYNVKHVFLENVPKLESMTFGCRAHSTMRNFSAAASQLKDLTICMVYRRKAPFWVPKMPNLKRLAVYDRCHFPSSRKIPFPVTSFLRASPCLEKFVMQISELVLEEGVGVDPVFQHASLKRLRLWWSCGGSPPRDNHIKLVRDVVGNCVALEEIQISRCHDDVKKYDFKYYIVGDDDSVRAATTEERASFENTTQLQLPAHVKLRIVNHTHKSSIF